MGPEFHGGHCTFLGRQKSKGKEVHKFCFSYFAPLAFGPLPSVTLRNLVLELGVWPVAARNMLYPLGLSSSKSKNQLPALMDLKDTEHQNLWEPLDGELLYTSLSGSATTACLEGKTNGAGRNLGRNQLPN